MEFVTIIGIWFILASSLAVVLYKFTPSKVVDFISKIF